MRCRRVGQRAHERRLPRQQGAGVVLRHGGRARPLRRAASARGSSIEKARDGAGDIPAVLGIEEEPGHLVLDHRGNAAAGGGRARHAARHGLDEHLGMALGERGQHEAVGLREQARHLAVRPRRRESSISTPASARPPGERLAQPPVADDDEPDGRLAHQRQGVDETLDVLLALEPSREQHAAATAARRPARRAERNASRSTPFGK